MRTRVQFDDVQGCTNVAEHTDVPERLAHENHTASAPFAIYDRQALAPLEQM